MRDLRKRLDPYIRNITPLSVPVKKPKATWVEPVRIFVDYLRNGRGTTAVGTYSPRACPGFPIAAPVTWKDIEHGIRPDAFNIFAPITPS